MVREALRSEGLAEAVAGPENQPSIPAKFVTVFLKSERPKGFGTSALRQLDPLEMPIPDVQIPLGDQRQVPQGVSRLHRPADEIKYFHALELPSRDKAVAVTKETRKCRNRYFRSSERAAAIDRSCLLAEQRPIRNMDGVLGLKRELNRAQIAREAEQNSRTKKLLQSNAEKVLQMRLGRGE